MNLGGRRDARNQQGTRPGQQARAIPGLFEEEDLRGMQKVFQEDVLLRQTRESAGEEEGGVQFLRSEGEIPLTEKEILTSPMNPSRIRAVVQEKKRGKSQ